jgi:ATP-dependent helicase/nuclease subunit B
VHVVTEWLNFEAERIPFTVAETEVKHSVNLAGITFNLRIDRVDRLNDSSLLVIDYKTGNVSPKTWELPRPDDVQLPLYAGFGVKENLGGFVFAKVRTGEHEFAGKVSDARATLLPKLSGSTSLVKEALTSEQLLNWKQYIEQLARDFVAGRADVDPREYPDTCERCGLQALCRIQEPENQTWLEPESDVPDEEGEDE